MRTTIARGLSVALALSLACCFSTGAARAAEAIGGTYISSGTITPGLTAQFQAQTIAESGQLAGGGYAGGPQLYVLTPCSFNGSSSGGLMGGDNLAVSEDVMSGSCGSNILVQYTSVRVGAVEVDEGAEVVNGSSGTHGSVCVWLPTSAPSVVTYHKVCVWI